MYRISFIVVEDEERCPLSRTVYIRKYLFSPEEKRTRIWLCLLCILLVYLHILAPFYLVALNVTFLCVYKACGRRLLPWIKLQTVVACGALPYITLLAWWSHKNGGIGWTPIPSLRSLVVTIRNLGLGYLANESYYAIGTIFFIGLVIFGCVMLRTDLRNVVVLLSMSLGPILILWVISRTGLRSSYVDRYFLPASIPLFTLVAAGLAKLKPIRMSILMLPLLFLWALAIEDIYANQLHPDEFQRIGEHEFHAYKEIAEYISANYQPGDVVGHTCYATCTPMILYTGIEQELLDVGGVLRDEQLRVVKGKAYWELMGLLAVEVEDALTGASRLWLIKANWDPSPHPMESVIQEKVEEFGQVLSKKSFDFPGYSRAEVILFSVGDKIKPQEQE
ncbi:hypothetical protein ACFL1X_03700 [Candidatus Hydrogenedentota bacterium]